MLVEFAKAPDAEGILQILSENFPPSLLPYIPLGCPGSRAYVADAIGLRRQGCDSKWIVARDQGIAGFAEMRLYSDELFVNHIYVRRDRQGRGLGSYLLKEALQATRQEGVTQVGLDVFLENEKAKHWYSRIGFAPVERYSWSTTALRPPSTPGWYCVAELPQAECIHARYGFSQFVLKTVRGSYRIGRLGDDVFRVGDLRLLEDHAALRGLGELGPARHLLAVCPDEAVETYSYPDLAGVATAVRMVAGLDEVVVRLGN